MRNVTENESQEFFENNVGDAVVCGPIEGTVIAQITDDNGWYLLIESKGETYRVSDFEAHTL